MKPCSPRFVRIACAALALISYATLALLNLRIAVDSVAQVSEPETTYADGYVACQYFGKADGLVADVSGAETTVELCRERCYSSNHYYALLQGGRNCYCSDDGASGMVLTNDKCALPCEGDTSARCGDEKAVSVYSVRSPDGNGEWTPWMRLEGLTLRTRYRGCDGDAMAASGAAWSCKPTVERNWTGSVRSTAGLNDYYVGCFTMVGLQLLSKFTLKHLWPMAAHECVAACRRRGLSYAVILTSGSSRTCACTSDLGTSMPADTCASLYGAQVFMTNKSGGEVTLQFSREGPAQKRVLLLGYFRGGTTFVASTLSHHPDAFYTYEPDALLGVEWPGVESFGKATALGTTLTDAVLTRYFRCDFHMLPGIFGRWYPGWGADNQGYGPYERCRAQYESAAQAAAKCRPVLEESCKRGPVLVAKTTRLLNTIAIKRFIVANKDVHVVHLIRDPRATLSSRRRLLAFYNKDLARHAGNLCNEIAAVDKLLRASNASGRLLTAYYERFALKPYDATSTLYSSLGLTVTDEVRRHLRSITSASSDDRGNYAFDIRRKNSAEHVRLYKDEYDDSSIKAIDKQCANLYLALGAAAAYAPAS